MESGAGPPPKLLFAAFIFQMPVKFGLSAAPAVAGEQRHGDEGVQDGFHCVRACASRTRLARRASRRCGATGAPVAGDGGRRSARRERAVRTPRRRSLPSQLVDRVEQRDVLSQRRQIAEQHDPLALALERLRQRTRTRRVHAPRPPVGRDRFEVAELGEHRRGRFRAPSLQSRISVGAVADQRQVVRDRRRRHAELRDDAGFVANRARAPIHLHDARAADALREILVRRADDDARRRADRARPPPPPRPAHRRPRIPPSARSRCRAR